jgi:hypothetical protein
MREKMKDYRERFVREGANVMRLFDETNDRSFQSLILLLTMDEVREFRDDLDALIQNPKTMPTLRIPLMNMK